MTIRQQNHQDSDQSRNSFSDSFVCADYLIFDNLIYARISFY